MTRSDRSPHGGVFPSGVARIAVDLLGGDGAPAVVVDGALRACSADPDLHLILVGPQAAADEVIGALAVADRERVSVIVVEGHIGMADAPLRNIRRETTVRATAEAVYAGRAHGMVSAGSSGAAVAASSHVLGRLRGVRRPGLAAALPTPHGPVLLVDVGVTLDATMLELVQHAVLGAAYAVAALKIQKPRVGLLSIGSEPGKGDRLRRAVSIALSDIPLPAGGRYVGLVQGHDVPQGGPADVVVTDGFTGNVLLKGIEGALRGTRGHEAAAVLLGVVGDVVVCHGSATGADIADGITLAARLHRDRIIPAVAGLADDLLTELSSAGGLTIRDALGERS
ncbi:phosphate acyltransferase PlsX [Dactylosporangium fulvum]|uniref:Phosphate acyltransferase n=1 Tax=Dactylosporangium fulvum TaxID=53359 RepID=A0ABY5W4C6_9ACTN|nr:phosphate acyltransferase PlsX [Dactylosporangium fulvum]UWP84109.1 phosphate acyltransferase PlsX [Dactylosporangium fulvum]